MRVLIDRKYTTDIENQVVKLALNQYREEKLIDRKVFQQSFKDDSIDLDDLIEESGKILIPWQLFFLTEAQLLGELNHIDSERVDRVSSKLVSKRKGTGDVTSKRIIDRLIRHQNFINRRVSLPKNPFCGSIKGMQTKNAVINILNYFEIDRPTFWKYITKGRALNYLIDLIERKNINISRAVLVHKLLPHASVVSSSIYKNTSGFVIKDEFIPFIFLPNEINPDEIESRQIYTLVYLLVIIGLDQYDYFLEKNFKAKILSSQGIEAQLHSITSELLMPNEEIEKLKGSKIDSLIIDNLSVRLKVSPLALVTTLRKRGVISKQEYDLLKPPPFVPGKTRAVLRTPSISHAVEKFCGKKMYEVLNQSIKNSQVTPIQAQYLIFGAVNKKNFLLYRKELRI